MTDARLPNLFIIGAPKCGTTAMSRYLAEHPDIFMSEQAGVKEPRYFCSDCRYLDLQSITTWDDYLSLFKNAPREIAYWGEATPHMLSSSVGVPEIIKFCKNPRFIAMLRNPVDLVVSLHNQKVKEGIEDVGLEEAWRLQAARKKRRCMPSGAKDWRYLQYAEQAQLGSQMHRLFKWVDKSQVHCIFFDDLGEDTASVFGNVLAFLQLPDSGRVDFKSQNQSVTFRSEGLEAGLQKFRRLRESLGLPGGLGLHAFINRFNTSPGRDELRPEFRRELTEYFRDEVSLLEDVTGRDLAAWKTV